MSAITHIKAALEETAFAAPNVKVALAQLIDSVDQDLDRAGYKPSSATEARVRQLIAVIAQAAKARAAPEDEEEEQRDTQRMS